MKTGSSLAAGALLIASALAESLPACSARSATPCACPKGTNYSESSTYSIIGAETADVEALLNDCMLTTIRAHGVCHSPSTPVFQTGWLGAVPHSTSGPNNKVGSTRTSNFPTPIGYYDVSEKVCTNHIVLSYS